MKALITGGAGFIGSHLCEELLARGYEVVVLDDLSTGCISNLQKLEHNPKFHCVIDSVLHERVVEDLVRDCDQVIHLAAAVGVRLIVEQPVKTIQTNIAGSENVLRLASRYRKKVLIASTSEVYGKSSRDAFSEGDDLVLGSTKLRRWSYAASKIVDEFLSLAYWIETKLPVVIVRLFNTVGPRQTGRYGMVLPSFVKQALGNQPITVYGTGEQTRSFTYVSDVVKALADLINCPQAVGEVVNLGGIEEISINKLAEMVKEVTGSKSPITRIPYSEAYEEGFEDMQRRKPNITLANKLIGFAPRTSLKDIIIAVAEYQKQK